MAAAERPVRVEVDGQLFDVWARQDRPGQYDFAWVSGPNPGYGFTSAPSDASPLSMGDLKGAIRHFLAQVDPETGYIE